MVDRYTLRVFEDAVEFAAAAEPYLLQREAEHCLTLGLLHLLREKRAPDAFMALVQDPAGAAALVALRTPPYRLILSEHADGHDPREVVKPLLDSVEETPGVLGAVGSSAAFASAWAAATSRAVTLTQQERIYACREVVGDRAVKGAMVKGGSEHEELLVDWLQAFRLEATPTDPRLGREASVQAVERDLAAAVGGLWLWQVDGSPVCMAGARGPTRNGIRIGPVYTPPDLRGRGYAGALTAALTRRLLAEGRLQVTLFADLANPAANHVYQKIGYLPVAEQLVYDFR